MAPHAEDPVQVEYRSQSWDTSNSIDEAKAVLKSKNAFGEQRKKRNLADSYEPGRSSVQSHEDYEFDYLLPRFPDLHWNQLKEVPYDDKGLYGDRRFRSLLEAADDVFDYVPKIGTEISGVRLTQLTDAQKCDLARLIATRGVVFFRNQDDFDIEAQKELGKFFGTLHKHATTAVPQKEGLEDVHVVYTNEKSLDQRALFTPTFLWHSDVSYEVQPPSYTSLKVLTGPPRGGGGDTLWCSQYAIYDVLSPHMQKYLEGLTALHSADMQAQDSRAGGRPVRREPITTEHPLIRVNPVTGWKSVFFNPGFVTKIVGVPKAESDTIIRYLNELIATTQEAHVRFQWGKHDVALWDNRVTTHSASYGFSPHRRHAVRVAATAEKPYFDPQGKSQEEEFNKKWGLPQTNKDGSRQSNYND
ncbi:taurine dioxygenase [Capronia coronata CBS 617.96]|uniref:Taurine dioxygenase n=1 Tax=Capronia coronata CBS 617.96 TaxID=1182541 RepID=W9YXS0_9EURO|nr:taurine dioxygenase [Capronia coronata CBS 617.96]EXJ94071.1 taurine dioxygenase [Capronia coronata CBS 617.96]